MLGEDGGLYREEEEEEEEGVVGWGCGGVVVENVTRLF